MSLFVSNEVINFRQVSWEGGGGGVKCIKNGKKMKKIVIKNK